MVKTTTTKKTKKNVGSKTSKVSGAELLNQKVQFDFMTALLLVSLFINLFMLCLWVTLQTTSIYDKALFDFFIHR